jgi:hypothetical protein
LKEFAVSFTDTAVADLDAIYDYIADHAGSVVAAGY